MNDNTNSVSEISWVLLFFYFYFWGLCCLFFIIIDFIFLIIVGILFVLLIHLIFNYIYIPYNKIIFLPIPIIVLVLILIPNILPHIHINIPTPLLKIHNPIGLKLHPFLFPKLINPSNSILNKHHKQHQTNQKRKHNQPRHQIKNNLVINFLILFHKIPIIIIIILFVCYLPFLID